MSRQTILNLLQQWESDEGVGVQALADFMEVSRSLLYRFAAGEVTRPPYELIRGLVDAFEGVTLIGRDAPPTAEEWLELWEAASA